MENKEGKTSFKPIIIVMLISLVIAGLWDKVPAIKNSIHFILNPTAGILMNWELTIGMSIVVLVITILTTLVQKYATDQETLKELKKEQKEVQKQMKEFKNHPKKMMELQKKQMSFIPKQFKLSMRGMVYTGVPLILFFRWFDDYFTVMATTAGEPVRFLGFMGWFVFYIVASIVFSSILKKWMKVV